MWLLSDFIRNPYLQTCLKLPDVFSEDIAGDDRLRFGRVPQYGFPIQNILSFRIF